MTLRRARIISQAVFTALFLLMLLNAAWPLKEHMPYTLFLTLDPLISLTTMISARSVIALGMTGLVTLVLTVVIGRYFCAWVCPMGAAIDAADTTVFGRFRKKKNQKYAGLRPLKYFILAAVLAAAVFGLNLVFVFDPIANITRIITVTVLPPLYTAGNVAVRYLNAAFEMLNIDTDLAYFSFKPHYFVFAFGTTIWFGIITGLSVFQSRFWCRNVCPLGALLGLVSRFGLFKRLAADSCTSCKRCATVCPMGAISPDDPSRTELAECTLCGNCTADCEKQRIALLPGPSRVPGPVTAIAVSRRQFISSAGTGTVLALASATALPHKVVNADVIRPPGSLPETEFLNRCVRCGECMKACKTNCLQPSLLEAGWYGAMAPRAVFRVAGCEKTCNNCGRVCPTGAVRDLPLEEKQFVKMGTAVIDRSRCVAWERNKLCLLCDEICPYDAIEFRVVDDFTGPFKKPFIHEEKCSGCGMCEQKCPVLGKSAVYVISDGQERKASGSYITPEKRELRKVSENEFETDGIVGFGDGAEGGMPKGFVTEPEPAPATGKKDEGGGGGLPPGFTD